MDDADRLAEQVMEKSSALLLFARQWLDAASAEDVVQEALTALLIQRKPVDDPIAWMYRAVRNAAMNHSRSQSRRKRWEQAAAAARPDWFEHRAESLIDAEAAQELLQQLPEDQRQIVILRIWGGLGLAEIAAITQSKKSTVHDRYKRALEHLRITMEKPCQKKT